MLDSLRLVYDMKNKEASEAAAQQAANQKQTLHHPLAAAA
jgi:hypothetical protein